MQDYSVVQKWLSQLPARQQSVLLLATRGPDNAAKGAAIKDMVKYVRCCVYYPANPHWFMDTRDTFFRRNASSWEVALEAGLRSHDDVPHHFLMRLIHALEIVGYKHPDARISTFALNAYISFCDAFHMAPETLKQLDARLSCGMWQLKDCEIPEYVNPFES